MKLLLTLLIVSVFAQDQASRHAQIRMAHTEFLSGRSPEAERILRQALATMGAGTPADSRIAAHQLLGMVLVNMGRTREAWMELSKALALGPQGNRLGGLKHAMATASSAAGDLETAAQLMVESVELLEGTGEVWEAMVDQAGLEMARGKASRAAQLCNEALPMIESTRGRNHPVAIARIYTCAVVELERDPEHAERQLLLLLDSWSSQMDVDRAPILARIAQARLLTKRFADASSAIDEAVALGRTAGDGQLLRPCLIIRASILRAMKRKKEAAECEREAATLSAPGRNLVVDVLALRAGPTYAKPPANSPSR